jgi:hypothetical protein
MPSPMDNARMARFVARTTLTAKWPINASKPDDVALSMEKLREKLIAANLVGDGFSQPPAAGIPIPQAAIVRSMPAQLLPVPANSYGGPSVAVRNDGLRLECVGLLSKADRKDALSAAMTKARQHAAELAEAAGCHLGPLASVSGGVDNYSTPVMTSNVGVPPRNDGEYLGLPELPDLTVSVTLHFQIAP